MIQFNALNNNPTWLQLNSWRQLYIFLKITHKWIRVFFRFVRIRFLHTWSIQFRNEKRLLDTEIDSVFHIDIIQMRFSKIKKKKNDATKVKMRY